MTNLINQFAENWFNWELSMFWQVGLLIAIIAGLDLLIKRWVWPQVRYALWLLILVKLILPPTLTSPASFTAEIPFVVKQTLTNSEIRTQDTEDSIQNINLNYEIRNPKQIQITEIQKNKQIEIASSAKSKTRNDIAVPAMAKQLISWKVYVLFIWLAGVAILSVWLILRLRNLRHQHLKGEQSNLPQRLEVLLAQVATRLGLKRVPQVILTNKVCCPAVFGVFRPVLLMSADKLANMTAQDAEHIFLHELAHIKRGDLFVHAFYMLLQIAYWFNPLLWLARKPLQNLRELCCDATVAKLLKEKTAGYRHTLLETARQLLAQPVDPGLGLLGLFENSSWLVDRLKWLEKKSWRYRPLRIATIFILIVLMSACVIPMTKYDAPVDFVIKGTVTDAQTGKPIGGAKVGDVKEYAEGEFGTTTDANGNYSYATYYEEHSITAVADGYKKEKKTLLTKLFGSEKEKVINFELKATELTENTERETPISIKQLMKLAEEKARSLNHEYIGTEHILLVIAEEKGTASDILRSNGIDKDKLFTEIMKAIKKGLKPVTKRTLSETPRAKQAIDNAIKQADGEKNLNTGDILLGLIQVEDGVAAQVLSNLGLSQNDIRQELYKTQNAKSRSPVVQVCSPQIDPSREDMQILTGKKGEPGTLSGKVVDEKGNPIKDVLADVWHWYKGNETKTDANGYFYLGGFEPEQKTVEITFRKKNFTPKYLIRQPLGIKDVVVVLADKTYFEGTVIEPNGRPVPDASITANTGPKDCEGVRLTEVATKCKSDKDGHYKLYVQTDTYDIQVKSKQGVVRLQNVEINKDQAKKFDLVLDSGVVFLAKVLDAETNEPVRGVTFMSWMHKDVKGVSDSNGFVRIPNMLPGKFEFWVESKEYCRWWSEDCLSEWNHYKIDNEETGWQRNFDGLDFDLKNGMEPVTIIVEKGVKITGKVFDPCDNPVAGATAPLARTGSGNSLCGDTRYSFKTDANGCFEMMVPASKKAKYNLVAHDGKFEEWRNWANGVLEPIQTNPGDVIENVIIKLTEPAIVRGTVVDSSGKAAANRQVRAHAFDKLENRYYDPTVRTDANGNFELKFVRPGKQYIQAYPFWLKAEETPQGTSQIITAEAEQMIEGVKLIVQAPEEQNIKKAIPIENKKQQKDFSVTLSNGTTVELIGVCKHPSKGKQWWRPDGSLLEKIPYDKINVSIGSGLNWQEIEAAIQISDHNEGDIVEFKPQIKDSTGINTLPALKNDIGFRYQIKDAKNSGSGDCSKDNRNLQNMYSVVFDQPKGKTSTDMKLGIASGSWATLQMQKANFYGVNTRQPVIWHGPAENGGKTVVTVAHTLPQMNVRIVAIDKSGREYTGSSTSGLQKDFESVQTEFSLPLSDIKEFKFQARPYEWVEFKNVSLKPGVKTEVQIETKKATESTPSAGSGQAENTETKKIEQQMDEYVKALELLPKDTLEGQIELARKTFLLEIELYQKQLTSESEKKNSLLKKSKKQWKSLTKKWNF